MCLRPIKVRNPSRYFREGIDKEYITVPCGKCSECVNANRMDWQIRLYYEHIATEQLHDGFTFYFTLTYNNICPHLPGTISVTQIGQILPKSDVVTI